LNVEFSETAKNDLISIRDYIAEDDKAAAERAIIRILQSIHHLINLPKLGRYWRETSTRALSIPNLPYRVHYQIAGEIIEILTVVHTRRKAP
jgi:toxin ParE1/3/4